MFSVCIDCGIGQTQPPRIGPHAPAPRKRRFFDPGIVQIRERTRRSRDCGGQGCDGCEVHFHIGTKMKGRAMSTEPTEVSTHASAVDLTRTLPDGSRVTFTIERDRNGVGSLVVTSSRATKTDPASDTFDQIEHRGVLRFTASYDLSANPRLSALVPAFAHANVPNVTAQRACSFSLTASDDSALMILRGDLPEGVTMTRAGLVSGVPALPGSYDFTVRAHSDLAALLYSDEAIHLIARPPPLWGTDQQLPHVARDETMDLALRAEYTTDFAVVAGALPTGTLSIDGRSGRVTGVPTAQETVAFTVRASSSESQNAETDRVFTQLVATRPAWTFTSADLPRVTRDRPCDIALGATSSVTHALVPDTTLPPGLALSTLGAVSGQPASEGQQQIHVRAYSTTSTQIFADRLFAFQSVAPPVWTSPTVLAAMARGEAVTYTFTSTTGDTYSVVGETFPPSGLVLSAGGVVSGDAAGSGTGTYSFTVRATSLDSQNADTDQTMTLPVAIRPTWPWLNGLPSAVTANRECEITTFAYGVGSYSLANGGSVPSGTQFTQSSDAAVASQAYFVEQRFEGDYTADGTRDWFRNAWPVGDPTLVQTISKGNLGHNYSFRWRARVVVTSDKTVKFGTTSDNASHVWLDGVLIVDNGGAHGAVSRESTAQTLVAGTVYELDITYGQGIGGASMSFYYQWVGSTGNWTTDRTDIADLFRPADDDTYRYARIAGTITSAGTRTVDLRAHSVVAPTEIYSDKTITIPCINPPSWATASALPDIARGEAYAGQQNAFSASGADTYTVRSGSMPAGTSLLTDGSVSGSPSTQSDYAFTVRAESRSAQNHWQDRAFTQHVAVRPAFTFPTPAAKLTRGRDGVLFASANDAHRFYLSTVSTAWSPENVGGLNWSLFETQGKLTGSPGITGTFTRYLYAVSRTSTSIRTPDTLFSIQVVDPPSWSTGSGLQDTAKGEAYTQALSASPADTYQAQGTLPSWLRVSGSSLTGTPPADAVHSFTIRATDVGGGYQNRWQDRTFSLRVATRPTWNSPYFGNTPPMPNIAKGRPFNLTNAYASSEDPDSYRVIDGSVPPGVSVENDGSMSGSATSLGTWQWRTEVWSATSTSIRSSWVFRVSAIDVPSWNTAGSLNDVAVGEAYSVQFSATRADRYARQSGTLPAGLSLTSAGRLSGTASSVTTYTFAIRATDDSAQNCYEDRSFTQLVARRPVWNSPYDVDTPLQSITVNRRFNINMAYASHIENRGYRYESGTTPSGTYVTWDGTLGGDVATETGTYQWTVKAVSAQSNAIFSSQEFKISVLDPPTWNTESAVVMAAQRSFSLQLSASGADVTYTKVSGTFPGGVGLSTGGLLSGIPSSTGNFGFTLRASTSAQNNYSDLAISCKVVAVPKFINSPSTGVIETSFYAATLPDPPNDYKTDVESTREITSTYSNVAIYNLPQYERSHLTLYGHGVAIGDQQVSVRAYSVEAPEVYNESSFTLRTVHELDDAEYREFGFGPRMHHGGTAGTAGTTYLQRGLLGGVLLRAHSDRKSPAGVWSNHLFCRERFSQERVVLSLQVVYRGTWGTELVMYNDVTGAKLATVMSHYNAGTRAKNMQTSVGFYAEDVDGTTEHYVSFFDGNMNVLKHISGRHSRIVGISTFAQGPTFPSGSANRHAGYGIRLARSDWGQLDQVIGEHWGSSLDGLAHYN